MPLQWQSNVLRALLCVLVLYHGLVLSAEYKDFKRHYYPSQGFSIAIPKEWILTVPFRWGVLYTFSPREEENDIVTSLSVKVFPVHGQIDLEEYAKNWGTMWSYSLSEYQNEKRENILIDKTPAKCMIYSFAYKGASVKRMVYFIVKNQNLFTIICTTPAARFEEHRKLFMNIVDSIEFQSRKKLNMR